MGKVKNPVKKIKNSTSEKMIKKLVQILNLLKNLFIKTLDKFSMDFTNFQTFFDKVDEAYTLQN